jgi:hypothetical protein
MAVASLPLYEEDIAAWSEHQARALRALARARPDLSNAIDWENVAEEIEALGRSELRAVTGPLRQFLVHLCKAYSCPHDRSLARWRAECETFHYQAVDAYTPSMRRRIDIDTLWRSALKEARLALLVFEEELDPELPLIGPPTLDELLATDLSLDAALAILADRRRALHSQGNDRSRTL